MNNKIILLGLVSVQAIRIQEGEGVGGIMDDAKAWATDTFGTDTEEGKEGEMTQPIIEEEKTIEEVDVEE